MIRKWSKEVLKQMAQRTRSLMTIDKALHIGDVVDRLYVSRKQRTGLTIIGDSVDASMQRLGEYIKQSK